MVKVQLKDATYKDRLLPEIKQTQVKKYGCTTKLSWALFLSWILVMLLVRIVTDVLMFGENKDIPIRIPPQPLKGIEFRTTDDSSRSRRVSSQKVSRQLESSLSADSDESACETDDVFQYDIAFAPGPTDEDTMLKSVQNAQNAQDCRRLCELRDQCTHWTFEASKARCVFANESLHPIDTIYRQGAGSVRVALDKYIARRLAFSIPLPEFRDPLNCAFDERDKPFLDDSFNKSAETRGENSSLTDGRTSSGSLSNA